LQHSAIKIRRAPIAGFNVDTLTKKREKEMSSGQFFRSRRGFLQAAGFSAIAASLASMLRTNRLKAGPLAAATRRVVTGHDKRGKSIFLMDGAAPRVAETKAIPGLELVELWATDSTPAVPAAGKDPTIAMTSFVPLPGGTRFSVISFPPLGEGTFDAEAFRREYLEKAPGLAESLEKEDLAMHTTSTIDYDFVLSGEITLELDDGATVDLKAGDCVIQNGTRHAWRNRGKKPCVLATVMVGACRT
jgi:mannose-6-phosphate isomerase-like protein (cupin superfamily)